MIQPHENFSGGSNKGRRISIAGGGIGGLTAALAFVRSGAQVDIYEQAPAISEVGAGLQLTPNGNRVLAALGIDAAVIDASITAKAIEPMDALTGRRVTRFDVSNFAEHRYRFFHRAELIDLLLDCCQSAGAKLRVNQRVDTADLDADLVIGAEGIHSGTRSALNGAQDAEFTGQVAWRALIPAKEADPIARIWMAPRRHLVTDPVYHPNHGQLLNIVAVQERQQWASEGWAHIDDPGNLRHAFRDAAPEIKENLAQIETVNLWGLFRHPVAEVWAKDNVCILGDAAHPTLPFLAQGANLAIEDAYILARCCSDAQDIPAALARYQQLRKPRVRRAIAAANANATKYHLSGFARTVAHNGLKLMGKVAPNYFIGRMNWLYDYDVTGRLD